MNSAETFDENGYVVLSNALSQEECKSLVDHMFDLHKQGKLEKDDQCPLSDSVYGDEKLDALLERMAGPIGFNVGKKLLPTYTYARIYRPGEILKRHKDRPACQISATLTLGYDANSVWPILFDEDKEIVVELETGEMAVYKGCDIMHWRAPFKGNWHVQVFLHYVDADGPHADQKYDGRKCLGINKNNPTYETITNVAVFPNHISNEGCSKLIETYSQDSIDKELPYIGGNFEKIDRNIRDVERVMLPQNVGIGATLTATGLNANHYWWKYNITHANQTELLIYKPDGHYNPHVDTFHAHSDETRKLTALAFLNDDYEGGKFFLNSDGNLIYPPQEKGTVLIFPSYMVHGVEPVTKGIRYSAVTWLVGPYFK